jgi:hypothetical protein
MPKLTSDGKTLFVDEKPVIKGWESFSGVYWFGLEISEIRKTADGGGSVMEDGSVVDDVIWFGLVQGQEEEYGYFSEAEIKGLGMMAWRIKPQDLPHAGRRSR